MSRLRAGTRRRDRVRRLHDHRLERGPVDVHVMRGHRHHHRLALAVLAQKVDADLQMRAFHLAIDRLADVVHERRADGDVRVDPDFGRHDARQTRHLSGVGQHVLAVAGAVLQASHQPVNFGMQVVQPELEGDRGAFLAHRFVGLFLHLLDDFFDARRVNAAVGDQALDRLLGDSRGDRDRSPRG